MKKGYIKYGKDLYQKFYMGMMFHEGRYWDKDEMVIGIQSGLIKKGIQNLPKFMHLKQEWDQNPNKKGQEMNNQLNDIRMEAKARHDY